MTEKLINFVRDYFRTEDFIPLHAPLFRGNEKKYLLDAVDSTYVSSVGRYVELFENEVAKFTGASKAVATVNGTAALHTALKISGVCADDLVITQPLTFVATCNAIAYCGAKPVFVDVDKDTLGLSAEALEQWLVENARIDESGLCRTTSDNKIIRACIAVHTFGHPVNLDGLLRVTSEWNITFLEDAAESLGSLYKNKHTGTFGLIGTLSFNGNKIITTGGGGMILSSEVICERAKHLTTTAKLSHPYEYIHDEIGFNYRLPNLNAALGFAQMEHLDLFVQAKRKLAFAYQEIIKGMDLIFVNEPKDCHSNFWLNSVICENEIHKNALIKTTNQKGIMTRPKWKLMSNSKMFSDSRRGDLSNAEWLQARVVNLPSGVVIR